MLILKNVPTALQYRDPKTGLPYATKEAFKIIRERHSSNNSIKEKNSMGVLYDLTSQEVMGMTFPRDGAEGYIFKDMSEIMFKNRGIFRASRMEVFTLLVLHSDMLIEEEFHDVEHWSYLLSCWLFIVINSACYFTHRPCMYYNVIFLSLYAATHQEIQRKYSPLELKNLAISSKFSSSFVRHASWYVLVMCLSQKEIKGSAA
nr:SWR1 complex subunit 2 [Tanacetum cinerariifolium]